MSSCARRPRPRRLEDNDAPCLVYRSLLHVHNGTAQGHRQGGNATHLLARLLLVEPDLAAHPMAHHRIACHPSEDRVAIVQERLRLDEVWVRRSASFKA